MGKKYNIEIGRKFGKLTVLKEVQGIHKTKNKYYFKRVLCQCECGNLKEIDYCNLINGSTETCGCEHIQRIIEKKERYNTYDLSGEYGIGYTLKGENFYFDLEDYDKIKDYCWYKNRNGYMVTNMKTDNNKKFICFLHKIIMNSPRRSKTVVDHINRNPSDNRKTNLRIVTQAKNCINKSKQLNNTSGFVGVSWNKHRRKWEANIGVNNQKMSLGFYNTKGEAIKVRREAEEKYFGEFAPK